MSFAKATFSGAGPKLAAPLIEIWGGAGRPARLGIRKISTGGPAGPVFGAFPSEFSQNSRIGGPNHYIISATARRMFEPQ